MLLLYFSFIKYIKKTTFLHSFKMILIVGTDGYTRPSGYIPLEISIYCQKYGLRVIRCSTEKFISEREQHYGVHYIHGIPSPTCSPYHLEDVKRSLIHLMRTENITTVVHKDDRFVRSFFRGVNMVDLNDYDLVPFKKHPLAQSYSANYCCIHGHLYRQPCTAAKVAYYRDSCFDILKKKAVDSGTQY